MGLTVLERLQDIAHLQGIEVRKHQLPVKIRGLYYEDGNYRSITINTDVRTAREEVGVMAEEIGHSVVGGSDLLFPDGTDPVIRRKAELRARHYGYNVVLPAKFLIQSFKKGMEVWDIAEEYGVTEEFVSEAVSSYVAKGLIPEFGFCEEC